MNKKLPPAAVALVLLLVLGAVAGTMFYFADRKGPPLPTGMPKGAFSGKKSDTPAKGAAPKGTPSKADAAHPDKSAEKSSSLKMPAPSAKTEGQPAQNKADTSR